MIEKTNKTHRAVFTPTKSPFLPYSACVVANSENNEHVPNAVSNYCNNDCRSGKIKYRYNSLGFRGEDYNENAKFHIFVCGASESFGLGVNEEDTAEHQFKFFYARYKGVDPAEVNLLNFSQIGASMDYIARVIVSQCQIVKPDLVIGALSPSSRTEYFTDDDDRYFADKALTFNPAMLDTLRFPSKDAYNVARMACLDEEDRDELLTAIEGFYSFYTDRVGLINRLKNILLVQQYCVAQSIPHFFWTLHRYGLEKELTVPLPPSITGLLKCIDYNRIYTHNILPLNHQKATDRIHPGPNVYRGVAEHLWRFYNHLEKA